jgi:hypothetical protein
MMMSTPEPLSTHLFIESYFRDMSIVSSGKGGGGGVEKNKHPRWIAPVAGCIKLNVDAAMAKTGPGGAVAVVC